MARKRILHPDFFTDAELLSLPFSHRLLFAGLWCHADREGRLEDKPLDLKIKLFPADAVDVDAMLSALSAAGFVVRYEVAGRRYLWVRSFTRHQNPHPKESKSVLPAPPASCMGVQGEPSASFMAPKVVASNAVAVTVAVSDPVAVSVPPPKPAVAAAPSALLRCMDRRAEKYPNAIPEPMHVVRPLWEQVTAEAAIAKRDIALVEAAYARFLAGDPDPFWSKQPEPCPMRGFVKQWRAFVPNQGNAEPAQTWRILPFKTVAKTGGGVG